MLEARGKAGLLLMPNGGSGTAAGRGFLPRMSTIVLLIAALVVAVLPASAQQATPAPEGTAPLGAAEVVDRVRPAVVTVLNEQRVAGFAGIGSGETQPAGAGTGFI